MEARAATLEEAGKHQVEIDQLKAEAQKPLEDIISRQKQGRPTVAITTRKVALTRKSTG